MQCNFSTRALIDDSSFAESSPSSSHPGAVKLFPRRVWVRFQSNRGRTHLATIQRRVLNPSAKRLVMSQRPPNTKTKVTGVRIHKTRSNSSIAAMTMNQCQFVFTHLPSLLYNFAESSVEHDFRWMISVKINFHLFIPDSPRLNVLGN
jgi:hypothetical protein